MDIEFNEQRVRDVEIPLHQLEQRVLHLEGQMQAIEVEQICQAVFYKLNVTPKSCVPQLYAEIERVKEFISQFSKDPNNLVQLQNGIGNNNTAAQEESVDTNMKFTVNQLKNDMFLLKKEL